MMEEILHHLSIHPVMFVYTAVLHTANYRNNLKLYN